MLGCLANGPGALPDDAYAPDADAFAWPEAGPRDAVLPDAALLADRVLPPPVEHSCGPAWMRPEGCRNEAFRGEVWDCTQLDPCGAINAQDYLLACCECEASYCTEAVP